jgi:cbb3-type cytochrome oxidase maturation protein
MMQVLYIVVPLAMGMAGVALAAFVLAVRNGQFDDLDTPQLRAMFDDGPSNAADGRGPTDTSAS